MRWVVVLACAGCSFPGGGTPATDDAAVDPIDAPAGSADAPADGAPAVPDADPPDAAPPDARPCPAAPAGCMAFACPGSASCYFHCGPRTFAAARTRCTSDGIGCVVTIDDQAENDCIAAATTPMFPDLVWFGFFQSAAGGEPDGGWGWVCPQSTGFMAGNWGAFEPNDENGEDCAAMGAGGAWIDIDCGDSMRYVCEFSP
jgi:hypothetical protein